VATFTGCQGRSTPLEPTLRGVAEPGDLAVSKSSILNPLPGQREGLDGNSKAKASYISKVTSQDL
jgi:hypothetical protein